MPHSEDSAGEKEAKRQRSEPTTPVSTHSLSPYDYDAVMGITRVGTKETEGFEKGLDSPEYHDTIDEPTKQGDQGGDTLPKLGSIQGGFGSSSLKECIELLNATTCNAPAPLDSGVDQEIPDPTQKFHHYSKRPFLENGRQQVANHPKNPNFCGAKWPETTIRIG